MKQTAIVDRFEGDYVVLETEDGILNIPRATAPAMLCEGMVVEVEEERILCIDFEETQRREEETRRRFERILGHND